MKVLLFGATGMIGSGVLLECLDDPRVDSVVSIGRSLSGRSHGKLHERVRTDFLDFADLAPEVRDIDACFFCLGVSSAGMDEASYHRATYEITVAAAESIAAARPGAVFCYISGEGADSTEQSRTMWARIKGKTENRLLQLPLDTYIFRPGYIQPLRGTTSKTRLYQLLYVLSSPLFPLLQKLMPDHVTTTVRVGRAMIEVAAEGYPRRILENPDINSLASWV